MTGGTDHGTPATEDGEERRLMMSWRLESYDSIGEDQIARISAAVFRQISRHKINVPEFTVLRAQTGDPVAWLDLGDHIGRWDDLHAEDRRATCLLVAASEGSRWAAAILTLLLASAVSIGVEPEVRSRSLRALTTRFHVVGSSPMAVIRALGVKPWLAEAFELENRQSKKPDVPASTEPPPAPKPATSSGPAIRVVLQKPPTSTDRSLTAALATFTSLEDPVRLLTGPNPKGLARDLLAEFPWAPEVTGEIEMQLALDKRLGK